MDRRVIALVAAGVTVIAVGRPRASDPAPANDPAPASEPRASSSPQVRPAARAARSGLADLGTRIAAVRRADLAEPEPEPEPEPPAEVEEIDEDADPEVIELFKPSRPSQDWRVGDDTRIRITIHPHHGSFEFTVDEDAPVTLEPEWHDVPVGRTFSDVLGASASYTDSEGVSISSGDTVDNEYIVVE